MIAQVRSDSASVPDAGEPHLLYRNSQPFYER